MWKQPYTGHNMFTIKLKQLTGERAKHIYSSRETFTGRTCGFHAIHLPRQPNSMCNSNENVQMSKISTESAAFPSGAVFIYNSCFYISLPRFSGSRAIQKKKYIYSLKKYKQGKQAGMSRSPAAVLWFAFLSQTRHEMPGWSDRLKSFKGIINLSWRHFGKVVTSHLLEGCTQICFESPRMCIGLTIWSSRWATEESRPTCGHGALCPFTLTGCCLSARSPV